MNSGDNYSVYSKYLDRQARGNIGDLNQMPQNAVPNESLHCLPLIQQSLGTSPDCQIDIQIFRISTQIICNSILDIS